LPKIITFDEIANSFLIRTIRSAGRGVTTSGLAGCGTRQFKKNFSTPTLGDLLMKKSLLALAVLGAFAGAAQAQSAVTVYGSIDAGVRHKNNMNAAGDSRNELGSGIYNSNRLGFKGVEDLGGGMNARFNLELGFDSTTGAQGGAANGFSGTATNQLFDRAATVGLGGAWGGVDLGMQYSVAFKTVGTYDPFSYKFIGIAPLAGAVAGNQNTTVSSSIGNTRFANDIQYTGSFGPVTVRAEYALGEVAGRTSGNAAAAVGANYTAGPFTVGGAYTKRNPNLGTATVVNFQDNSQWTLGGAFADGPIRVAIGYMKEEQDNMVAGVQRDTKNAWVGGSYNITPAAALMVGYYQTKLQQAAADSTRKLLIVGGTYNLSKRTNLYANIDRAKFSGNSTFGTGATFAGAAGAAYVQPTGQTSQTGFSVGLNHLF
jgi:predicted porin